MYSKKYILEKIEEFNGHNPMYDGIVERICYLVYLNPGERGWFLYEGDDWYNPPRRVHTSIIKDAEYIEDRIVVTTENTRLTFVEVIPNECD